ncbi:winged helix-turn-helix transcriptional regulator [Candidatus Woesearchaeota archaeon]|nr:winged helix-turn-helix transcriptional regulator [Candidatus Woesearchaeota archaeon]
MSLKLDKKDRKILCELDMDARQSFAAIAKKVKLSKEVVNYRIKELEKKSLIQGYYAVLDITKMGYTYWRVFLKYHSISPEKEKEIMDYLRQNPAVGWVAVGDGRWDLTIVIWAKNLAAFEVVYDDFIFRYNKYFGDKYVAAAFKIYHFKRNYLYQTNDHSYALLGENKLVELDKLDFKILSLLTKNARMPAVDIADKLKCTANTIKNRIKKLTKEKIIIGFRAKLNSILLGYVHYKVFMHLNNLSGKKLKEIITRLNYNPNVIYITKSFGDAELEFEMMLKTKNDLYKFMKVLREKFPKMIRDYQTVLYYEEPLIDYFPI